MADAQMLVEVGAFVAGCVVGAATVWVREGRSILRRERAAQQLTKALADTLAHGAALHALARELPLADVPADPE